MATYNFEAVPVYGQVGGLVRIGTRSSSTFPVTKLDGTAATVVQAGSTQVGFVKSDATGQIPAFTTTDIPSVRINFGSPVTVHSLEAITAGAASAAAAAGSATSAQSYAANAAASAASVSAIGTDLTAVKAWRNLDISGIEPEFINRLDLKLANVMQGLGRDPVTGDWYATQTTSVGAAAGEESVIISHLNRAGRLLDSMEIVNAGHGSTFVVQNVGTDVYIWLSYAWGAAAGTGPRHEFTRFQYRAGATLTRDETTYITTLNKYDGTGGTYALMAADWANDRIAIRTNPSNSETFTLRRISDMLAGTNTTLGTIGPLSTVGTTFQAYAAVGDSLFVYRGANGSAHTVTEYSWTTGLVVRTQTVTSLGYGISAATSDTYNEPEGMTAYLDPFTNRTSLYFGKTRGNSPPAINRKALIFGYVPMGSSKGHGARLLALEDGGDTGWQTLTLASGYKAFSAGTTPSYRVINGRVQFRGLVSPNTGNFTAAAGVTVATIPSAVLTGSPISLRPEMDTYCASGTSGGATGVMSVSAATGALIATPATAASWISLGTTSWLLG